MKNSLIHSLKSLKLRRAQHNNSFIADHKKDDLFLFRHFGSFLLCRTVKKHNVFIAHISIYNVIHLNFYWFDVV